MGANPLISIIIPNYNGAGTIGKCLESIYGCSGGKGVSVDFLEVPVDYEVIVVDDLSEDGSLDIIKKFPCRLIALSEHSGASRARNEGVRRARGEALFFVDSDCMLMEDTLEKAMRAFKANPAAVTGGTYTPKPYDRDFYSVFQSISINYAETKSAEPDYIATHAMVMGRELFLNSGGFKEDFMPILEDVEFSHRLRRNGVRLLMRPDLLVRHIFNFSPYKSLRNAFRKSMYWTAYSLRNKDLLADSGTASRGLKSNVFSLFLCLCLIASYSIAGAGVFLAPVPLLLGVNFFANRHFLGAVSKEAGTFFLIKAVLYYCTLYAMAVGTGALFGALSLLKLSPVIDREAREGR